jgi:membrane protein implicated in regulation of membrane protease activity
MLIVMSMLVLAGSVAALAVGPASAAVVEMSALAFAGALFTAICASRRATDRGSRPRRSARSRAGCGASVRTPGRTGQKKGRCCQRPEV